MSRYCWEIIDGRWVSPEEQEQQARKEHERAMNETYEEVQSDLNTDVNEVAKMLRYGLRPGYVNVTIVQAVMGLMEGGDTLYSAFRLQAALFKLRKQYAEHETAERLSKDGSALSATLRASLAQGERDMAAARGVKPSNDADATKGAA